ncbi:MAG: LysR family transcriptional regulator [Gammaproteobacteria bacterium]|nr:MAG: LysR family transcriptional regulator [Gammaproteobacteria bacterium]
MKFKNLPPINRLRIFESAARMGSFKGAAEELFLTPSAISHQIKALEDGLGKKLFDKNGRQIVLTEEGHSFAQVVREAFDSILLGTHELQKQGKVVPVRLRVASVFGKNVLFPFFEEFEKAHRNIKLDITWEDDLFTIVDDAFEDNRFDAAIVWGGGYWEKYEIYGLMETQPCILGSPDIIKHDIPLSDFSLICEYPLIVNNQAPNAWKSLTTMPGININTEDAELICVDCLEDVIDAVLRGDGITLNDKNIYRPYIKDGRVKVFSDNTLTGQAYYLVYPDSLKSPEMKIFIDFLMDKIKNDLPPVKTYIWPGMKGNILNTNKEVVFDE